MAFISDALGRMKPSATIALTQMARDLKANLLMLKHLAADEAALQNILDNKSMYVLRKAVELLLADIPSSSS